MTQAFPSSATATFGFKSTPPLLFLNCDSSNSAVARSQWHKVQRTGLWSAVLPITARLYDTVWGTLWTLFYNEDVNAGHLHWSQGFSAIWETRTDSDSMYKKKQNRHNSILLGDVSVSLLPSRWRQWRGLFLVFDIQLTFLLLLRRLRGTEMSRSVRS